MNKSMLERVKTRTKLILIVARNRVNKWSHQLLKTGLVREKLTNPVINYFVDASSIVSC